MTPTIGRIVIYNTNQEDRDILNKSPNYGNSSHQLPAIVVAVWNDNCLNLRVMGDSPVDLWKTSIMRKAGDGHVEGTWEWPQINK